jgi:CRISPR-associated endonuclease/helicase Cas3
MTPEGFIAAYWGKARPVADGPDWHPLAYHALDVAAAMSALLDIRRAWLEAIARNSDLSADETRKRLILVAALHDLGKFAENFQWKAPAVIARLQPAADARLARNSRGHGDVGHVFWDYLCDDRQDGALDSLSPWVLAAVAHHGAPTDAGLVLGEAMSRAARADAGAFIDSCFDLIGRPSPAACRSEAETWRVAGLVMLADWIGSNQRWFPYAAPLDSLDAYWRGALVQAARAVREADLAEAPASCRFDLQDLLGVEANPSPLQAWAAAETVSKEPAVYFIEDLTGSGKTEAALILAHRMMAAGHAEGIYWALPTMATANGLYLRLRGRYQALFDDAGETPSLVLAHGGRDLNARFQASVGPGAPGHYGTGRSEQDDSGEAHCAAFIAEDRKKTFLAQVGVGTLDQALLATLPVRHQALRLATLSRRVLVVDEAHAYDPYMTAALERLLAFQAALGGSAIVLSATLPDKQRRRYAAVYNAGAQGALSSTAYPLVSSASASTVTETPQPTVRGTRRDLEVRRQDSPEAAMEGLLEAAHHGRCGVYVRNTVKDALEATAWLRDRAGEGIAVSVFHARFALGDRLARENDVLARFGQASTPAERHGQILVATQVVEQSLDLDFDHMATDLCPMDLLIQRAGRLHRHGHRPIRPAPVLDVVAPLAVEDAPADWYAAVFPVGRHVYPDVGQLWRTQRLLEAFGGLPLASRSPRDLIEPVFGDDRVPIPDALVPASQAAEAKDHADRGIGRLNVLKVADFSRGAGAWDSDIRTPTRLGEPSVIVRLARWQDGILSPWYEDIDPYQAWRLSEITLRVSQFKSECPPDEDCRLAMDAMRASWPSRMDIIPIMALTSELGELSFYGRFHGSGGRITEASYTRREGLRL